MLVEESQAAMETRWYCWITRRGWSHYHSLSLSTYQHRRLNPAHLVLPGSPEAKQLCNLHVQLSLEQSCHLGNPSPPGKPQEQTTVDDPHAEVEIESQLKPRGSVVREEDPKNLPPSCIRCRLNPHDQLGRFCVYGIYKRSLRAPTKENTLVLIAVDIGGKNTQE